MTVRSRTVVSIDGPVVAWGPEEEIDDAGGA